VGRRPDPAFDPDDLEIVRTLVTHASVGMAAVKERIELHQALSTRTLIGQAEGVLMHAFSITADQAFACLRRVSQERNMKLVKVAMAVLETGPMLQEVQREPEPPDDPTLDAEPAS
jgi:AmiR/NasT family two-component response regulator